MSAVRLGVVPPRLGTVPAGGCIVAIVDGDAWRFFPDGCACGDKPRAESQGQARDGHTTEAAAQLCAARLRGGA